MELFGSVDGQSAAYVRMWSIRLMLMLLDRDLSQARSSWNGRLARLMRWSRTVSNSRIVGRVDVLAWVEMTHLIHVTWRSMLPLPSRRRRSLDSLSEERRKGASSASDHIGSEVEGGDIGRALAGWDPCLDCIFHGLSFAAEVFRA